MTHYKYEACRDLVRLVLNTRQYVAGQNVPPSVFKRPEFRKRFPDKTPESLYAKFNNSLAMKKISELKKEYKICLRNGIYELKQPAEDEELNLNEERNKDRKTTSKHGSRGPVIKDF